jgi:hypothetical protein
MKKIIATLSLLVAVKTYSQIAIGKNSVTPASNISLEFYDAADNVKGLVLPWVSTVANNPIAYDTATGAGYQGMQGAIADGTVIFDLSDKKVKYRKAGVWFDLTGNPVFPLTVKNDTNADVTYTQFNTIDSSKQDGKREATDATAIIGSNPANNTAPGILVLSDQDKAMVLPKVASPHLNIKNPAPGMIVFDTTKKQLAVFNGTVWSFWKP